MYIYILNVKKKYLLTSLHLFILPLYNKGQYKFM